jgi:hypothetical protein
MRVFLEEIDGVHQGACFPFRQGFTTGVIGVHHSTEGFLFTGGCARGWPTRGTRPYAFERVEWSGITPFEMKEMRARSDGFEVVFTDPVDRATARKLSSWSMKSYTYRYHRVYGSPEVDHETPTIRSVEISPDGLRARLIIEGLRVGYIHELQGAGVRSAAGESLLHDVAYYTLNTLPR